jgi:hypothetical protein
MNNYPVTSEFGNNGINLSQAIVGAINVPASATNPFSVAPIGVAGYGVSASSSVGAVGTFGFGGILTPNALSWGGNFLVTNCPSPNCTTGTGYSGGTQWGIEVDANIMKAGGTAPVTKVFGVDVIGASETQVGVGGLSWGMVVQALGIGTSPPTPWQIAYVSADGAAVTAMSVGGTTVPGTTGPSQNLCFNAWNGSTPIGGCINESSGGIMQLANNGGFITLAAAGVAGFEISSSTVNVLAPSTAPGTTSEALDFQAYNSAGTMIAASMQLVPALTVGNMYINVPGGSVIFQSSGVTNFGITPSPASSATAISALVNNNAGVNLVTLTLGAPNSCGTARCVIVPN